ncbi:MAG: hypothetical protein E6H93_09645, partial [Chloroflexi bacterium]
MSRKDVEARLRRQAQDFDDKVPKRPDFERRVVARAYARPRAAGKRPVIIRDLALAGLVVLLIGSLGFGVMQLRNLRQATAVKTPLPSGSPSGSPTPTAAPTLGPTLSYTPGL